MKMLEKLCNKNINIYLLQIINLVDILDEVIDEIKNMENTIKSTYQNI